MNFLFFSFDIVTTLTLLWLAWQLLRSSDIFKSVIFFISFGLLMAIAWVRLHAPDVALAEAAIGAGLTGPLFLAAMKRMELRHRLDRRTESKEERKQNE